VVLGAAADEIRRIVPCGVPVVVASDWEMGMGVSLRAGIAAMKAAQPEARATVVMLVDTPGVGPEVVRRLVSATVGTCSGQRDRAVLALGRATYHGEIGHPVLLGRDHWDGVFASAQGDRGARRYLDGHDVTLVECGDIGTGDDIDNAEAFNAWVGQQT
jgi:CTP:molybdopterin cytidylyltransferase MocA